MKACFSEATCSTLWRNGSRHRLTLSFRTAPTPRLEARTLSRHFLAAILRRAWEQTTNQGPIKRAYDQGYMDGKQAAEKPDVQAHEATLTAYQKLQANVAKFENASGLSIGYGWNLENVGALVRLLTTRPEDITRQMERTLEALTAISRDVAAGLERLKQTDAPSEPQTSNGASG